MSQFYRKQTPDIDDVVMFHVVDKNEFGYQGTLPEYQDMEAVADFSELFRKRLDKKHIFNINQNVPLLVKNIDKTTGMVELSKKRLDLGVIQFMNHKFENCCYVNKLVNEIFAIYQFQVKNPTLTLNQFMDYLVWKHYDVIDESDHNATQGIQPMYENMFSNVLKDVVHYDILSDFLEKNQAIDITKHMYPRISRTNMVLETTVELLVTQENGCDIIRDLFSGFDSLLDTGYTVTVISESPPKYVIRIEGPSEEIGSENMSIIKQQMMTKFSSLDGYNKLQFIGQTFAKTTNWDIHLLSQQDLQNLN